MAGHEGRHALLLFLRLATRTPPLIHKGEKGIRGNLGRGKNLSPPFLLLLRAPLFEIHAKQRRLRRLGIRGAGARANVSEKRGGGENGGEGKEESVCTHTSIHLGRDTRVVV